MHTNRLISSALFGLALTVGATVLPGATPAGATPLPTFQTGRASSDAGFGGGADGQGSAPIVSGDGRFVGFTSNATDVVVPHVKEQYYHSYVRDTLTGSAEIVDVSSAGAIGDNYSQIQALSGDGRYVVFESRSTNLVPNDTNASADVFLRDRFAHTTERLSLASNGAQAVGNGQSMGVVDAVMTDDARYIAFASHATNLVAGDTNGAEDVFVRDRQTGSTERVSVGALGQGTFDSYEPAISADGRAVAFVTGAPFAPDDANKATDIYLRDRLTATTSLVSRSTAGVVGGSYSWNPTISDDGRYVAFVSIADNLIVGDPVNGANDAFVRDRTASTTLIASVGAGGFQTNGQVDNAAISGDGKTVVFNSGDSTLVAGDTDGKSDIFARRGNVTTRVGLSSSGAQPNDHELFVAVSTDGQTVAFDSKASNLVAGDKNDGNDIFWHRQLDITPFPTLDAFIARQLTDFNGSSSTAGVYLNRAVIEKGESPEHLVAALAQSKSFGGVRAPVIRLYLAYFEREPDTSGLSFWIGQRAKGATLDTISQAFAKSSEFKNTYGSTTNSAFVNLVYKHVLGRDADAAGTAFWVAKMAAGMSRGRVMTSFSESSEGVRHFRPKVDITLLGLGLFHHVLPAGLYSDGTNVLQDEPIEVGAQFLLHSAEYK